MKNTLLVCHKRLNNLSKTKFMFIEIRKFVIYNSIEQKLKLYPLIHRFLTFLYPRNILHNLKMFDVFNGR